MMDLILDKDSFMMRFIIIAHNGRLKSDIILIIRLGYTRMFHYLYSFH